MQTNKTSGNLEEKMCEKITIGVYVSNQQDFARSEKPKLPTDVY